MVNLIPSDRQAAGQNTVLLQQAVDKASQEGGTIFLPKGVFYFASAGKDCLYRGIRRQHTIGEHVILCRDNVTIIGQGKDTVLRPIGETAEGLDMFYYNEFLDSGTTVGSYLSNDHFRAFCIDSSETSCRQYTTAGKGFMLNLCRDCTWEEVEVYHTDGTGFGMDCTVRCRIDHCYAEGCGKGATENDGGASGFGIGYGFSEEESMTIRDCTSIGNTKFGFFFEHQARFMKQYKAAGHGEFLVESCTAKDNLYDFGGMMSEHVTYRSCRSLGARAKDFYFGDGSHDITLEG